VREQRRRGRARSSNVARWDRLPLIRTGRGSLDAGAFAFVMATGIVSVAASAEGLAIVSDALLVFAISAWIGLASVVFPRAVRTPRRPRLQSFALVASTAVIGARFALTGDDTPALALWSLALLCYGVLVLSRPSTGDPSGGSLLIVVATESLAVLAALLAPHSTAALLVAALLAWTLGLCLYPLLTAAIVLALYRRPRFAPELWIVMGALAVATLAGAELLLATRTLRALPELRSVLLNVDLTTWSLASSLIVPLLLAEVRSRGSWRYDASRWSFVFPLGMYAVATKTLAQADALPPLNRLGTVFSALALAAWLVVLAGLARRAVPRLRRAR
jgi:tellurite resistance protein TehA-like permease